MPRPITMSPQPLKRTLSCICITVANLESGLCSFCRKMPSSDINYDNEVRYLTSGRFDNQYLYKQDPYSVLEYMILRQNTNRHYNKDAFHLEFRQTLIFWIKEANQKLLYSDSTYHLGCSILDAVLSLYAIEEKNVKLVCFISLHLAAKLHENDDKILTAGQISDLFHREFSTQQIINCETVVFKTLGFNVNIQTPYSFLEHIMSMGLISTDEIEYHRTDSETRTFILKFEKIAYLFIETSLLEYDTYLYPAITVAISAIMAARAQMGLKTVIPAQVKSLVNLKSDTVGECTRKLYETCKKNFSEKLDHILEEKAC